ncbi:CinA family protein [Gracilinema caldarium]|uniref:CinA family protein n=1 Tax=Gracilinema caldarium TaxID=215591 RepID=UPI0026E950FD|nr:CinA family protein [Gracilinema caldarium]
MRHTLAEQIFSALKKEKLTLVCAESCTAGLISDTLAAIPGISSVFWGSFVCYQNAAKEKMLGIDPLLIQRFGPVSQEIAEAMSAGALEHSSANIALAITGIAGPDSDEFGTPVGTVWISFARHNLSPISHKYQFQGDRQEIRSKGAMEALKFLLQNIEGR